MKSGYHQWPSKLLNLVFGHLNPWIVEMAVSSRHRFQKPQLYLLSQYISLSSWKNWIKLKNIPRHLPTCHLWICLSVFIVRRNHTCTCFYVVWSQWPDLWLSNMLPLFLCLQGERYYLSNEGKQKRGSLVVNNEWRPSHYTASTPEVNLDNSEHALVLI